jgi:D-alanyl-lipoteichoic acid acyltransferase DltB (MBOAT superfamily)
MLFHSPPFLLGFLPVFLVGFFLLGRFAGHRWVLGWMLAASLFFYGWWNPVFVLLPAGSILGNYAIASRIRRSEARAARRWLASGVALNLFLLGWFKYADFLLHSVMPHAPALGIFLPLAISFFTFQQIMFLVGTARGECTECGLLPYAGFVAFFPHLIAGPIVRPRDIVPQLMAPGFARLRGENISAGATLLLLGLAKKLVLGDTFGRFADIGFDAAAHGAVLSFVEAWYATLAYSLQIYFDFSGYSDMAVGLARMLNVRFPANFASPYQARSIAEFWRRWHITLGWFLRDYLYIPLGGSRCGEARRTANLMLTMLLCGLWHGAAWSFVLWGGLHGLYLVLQRAWPIRLPGWLAQELTLLAVVVAWVPFRADGLYTAWSMLRAMLGLNGIVLPQMIVHAAPLLGLLATPVPVLPYLGDARTLSFPEVSACLLLGWAIVLLMPSVQALSETARLRAVTASFAFSVQALFFAPHVVPFLYFRF